MAVPFFATWRSFSGVGGLIILAMAQAGCARHRPESSPPAAISNRAQTYDRFITVIKLSTPPLLSAFRAGGTQVDPRQRQQLLQEQEAAVRQLQSLSPDLQILYRYRMVLNGLAVIAPRALEEQLRGLDGAVFIETSRPFGRVQGVHRSGLQPVAEADLDKINSASFIGAQRVHDELHLTGSGIKVGVIDSGIDYTHAMFGGPGTAAAYQATAPDRVAPGTFPTRKVVGGIDLVGSDFDGSSPDFAQHIPHPDANPLDEQGHGTHVAGTIAGLGDGRHTYAGVAPDAELYAIKIFGKTGSASDAVIIEALEYAANPSGDLDPRDHLDVVNLSLGEDYGLPHQLYSEAIDHLTAAGTVAVIAAGNAGATPYIVGAPSTAAASLSVAASVDAMPHNWQLPAVAFSSSRRPRLLAPAIEAPFAKPIKSAGAVAGSLVAIGSAGAPLSPTLQAAVRGHVALIDGVGANFGDAAKLAEGSGAIAVIGISASGGAPVPADSSVTLAIPALEVSRQLGTTLHADLAGGDVLVQLQTDEIFNNTAAIDSVTDFSSRGPRALDGLLKPEISAPGANIISADMGTGTGSTQMSGTSMACPHVAGVMALLKQAHPQLGAAGLKSLAMSSARPLVDADAGRQYPLTAMGAGRVQAFEAATATIITSPSALSLGELSSQDGAAIPTALTVTNLSDQSALVGLSSDGDASLSIIVPPQVELPPHGSRTVTARVHITSPDNNPGTREVDGAIVLRANGRLLRVPVMAMVRQGSGLDARSLRVRASGPETAAGAEASLTLVNGAASPGTALLFNRLAEQAPTSLRAAPEHPCALASAGWRLLPRTASQPERLQIAVKLAKAITNWQLCEVSVQIAGKWPLLPEQELLGTSLATLTQDGSQTNVFVSALTDANMMRDKRRQFETAREHSQQPDYSAAILDQQAFLAYGHAAVGVVTADLNRVARTVTGDMRVKIAVLGDSGRPGTDYYLGGAGGDWFTLRPDHQSFTDLPELVRLDGRSQTTVHFKKGNGDEPVIVYLPDNATPSSEALDGDRQSQVLTPIYSP